MAKIHSKEELEDKVRILNNPENLKLYASDTQLGCGLIGLIANL